MRITREWLKEIDACSEGVDWFHNQKETDGTKVIKKLIKEDRIDWANWTICRMFSKKQKIQYAVYAAEQVIDIFEKKYPDDKRPRKAIEAAKKCIENDTEENRSAAWSAASAWRSAARSAASAESAAWSAESAESAAWSAASAWSAAWGAASAWSARSAASAASAWREKMQLKILKYGISLLKT